MQKQIDNLQELLKFIIKSCLEKASRRKNEMPTLRTKKL